MYSRGVNARDRWPLALAAASAVALAVAAALLWPARSCVAPLVVVGPAVGLFAIPAVLGAVIGLAASGSRRRGFRALSLVLLLVAAPALLSLVGFAAGAVATTAIALVVSAARPGHGAALAFASAVLAALALRFAVGSTAVCATMSSAVAGLASHDRRCAGVESDWPEFWSPVPGDDGVSALCRHGRAELFARAPHPLGGPLFFLHWRFDRELGRWVLAD